MTHPFHSLVDIGANLTHDSFDTDFDQVIERAQAAGVKTIMLTGTDLSTSQQAAQYSKQQPTVFRSTAGFHPHVANQWDYEASAVIRELVGRDEVVAIGECGLDFNRDFSLRETQLQVFEEHLKIAEFAQKPLFLHQREAHEGQDETQQQAGVRGGPHRGAPNHWHGRGRGGGGRGWSQKPQS